MRPGRTQAGKNCNFCSRLHETETNDTKAGDSWMYTNSLKSII